MYDSNEIEKALQNQFHGWSGAKGGESQGCISESGLGNWTVKYFFLRQRILRKATTLQKYNDFDFHIRLISRIYVWSQKGILVWDLFSGPSPGIITSRDLP